MKDSKFKWTCSSKITKKLTALSEHLWQGPIHILDDIPSNKGTLLGWRQLSENETPDWISVIDRAWTLWGCIPNLQRVSIISVCLLKPQDFMTPVTTFSCCTSQNSWFLPPGYKDIINAFQKVKWLLTIPSWSLTCLPYQFLKYPVQCSVLWQFVAVPPLPPAIVQRLRTAGK